MFGLFAGIGMFLATFFTFPIGVFAEAGLPTELKAFVGCVYGVMYVIAILTWFKGGGEF
jgi:hypothetical protein